MFKVSMNFFLILLNFLKCLVHLCTWTIYACDISGFFKLLIHGIELSMIIHIYWFLGECLQFLKHTKNENKLAVCGSPKTTHLIQEVHCWGTGRLCFHGACFENHKDQSTRPVAFIRHYVADHRSRLQGKRRLRHRDPSHRPNHQTSGLSSPLSTRHGVRGAGTDSLQTLWEQPRCPLADSLS